MRANGQLDLDGIKTTNMSYQALSFKSVLPSAVSMMLIGLLVSVFYQPWSWSGVLGLWVFPIGILFGSLLYFAVFSLSISRLFQFESIQSLSLMLHQLFKKFTWPQIILVSFLAGIGEEILIRGALQSFLVSMGPPLVGIFAASMIFGLLHFLTKFYVLLTFLIGLVFALVFHATNSMLVVMVAHTVYDIIAFAMIVKFPHMLKIESSNEQIPIVDEGDC